MDPSTQSSLDRRHFLRQSAAAGAALTLQAAAYTRVSGANERLGVGFIGVGARGQAHLDIVSRLARVGYPITAVGVCDVWDGEETTLWIHNGRHSYERRYAQGLYPSAQRVGLNPNDSSRVVKDYRRLLDRSDVDLVCIATPDHWHARMAIDAATAGKHIYCESPMTRTADEAVAVVRAINSSARIMIVGVPSLANPVWQQAAAWIESGRIGPVSMAQAGVFRNDIRGHARYYPLRLSQNPQTIDWDMFLGHRFSVCGGSPLAPKLPFDRATYAHWRCHWAFSAGLFSDFLYRSAMELNSATELALPAKVVASGGIYLEQDQRQTPDTLTVIADYLKGCQLVLQASSLSSVTRDPFIRGRFGTLQFTSTGFDSIGDQPKGGKYTGKCDTIRLPSVISVAVESPRFATRALWENLIACIRGEQTGVLSPLQRNAATQITLCMAEQSYREDRVLFWDPRQERVTLTAPHWARRWEQRSQQVGISDPGVLESPEYMKLAGPWPEDGGS